MKKSHRTLCLVWIFTVPENFSVDWYHCAQFHVLLNCKNSLDDLKARILHWSIILFWEKWCIWLIQTLLPSEMQKYQLSSREMAEYFCSDLYTKLPFSWILDFQAHHLPVWTQAKRNASWLSSLIDTFPDPSGLMKFWNSFTHHHLSVTSLLTC